MTLLRNSDGFSSNEVGVLSWICSSALRCLTVSVHTHTHSLTHALFYLACLYVCVHACYVHIEIMGHLAGVSSLLSSCGSLGLNPYSQAWQQGAFTH